MDIYWNIACRLWLFARICLSEGAILKSRRGLSRGGKEEIDRPKTIAAEAVRASSGFESGWVGIA